jgi:hypothetical protein
MDQTKNNVIKVQFKSNRLTEEEQAIVRHFISQAVAESGVIEYINSLGKKAGIAFALIDEQDLPPIPT